MSKPSPAPAKPNFVSNLLLMVAVFMGIKLWMDSRNPPAPIAGKQPTTAADVLKQIRAYDAEKPTTKERAQKVNDETVHQLLPSYNNFVDAEVKDVAKADELKTQAAVLAAHIQVTSGIATDDTNKLRMAYNTLEGFERKEGDKPVWKATPIEITEGGQTLNVTGQSFMKSLIGQISERNKSDLIWGAIPGGYAFIDWLVGITGHNPNYSYAFATLLLAFLVRAVVFPLSQKQLMMSRKMSQLVPRLTEIKAKFKDDQIEANKRSMELYSRYGINPFAGCLPALVQMPLFLTVYQCILHYQFEFTKGYFLWINPASSARSNGFFAPNLGQQDYILIVIYSVTMVISTLLTPVSDPTQAKQQRMIGVGASIIFPVMMLLRLFPVVSGFVLYWTFTNLFSMAQSIRAYRMPMPELVEVNAPGGGVFPGKPKGRWATMMEEMQKAAETEQNRKKDGGTGEPSNGKPSGKGSPNGSLGGGKVSPSRPVGETGEGGTGTPAKHKPKKRR